MSIDYQLFCDLCKGTIATSFDESEMKHVIMRSPVVRARQIVYQGTDPTLAGKVIDRCSTCFLEDRTEKK